MENKCRSLISSADTVKVCSWNVPNNRKPGEISLIVFFFSMIHVWHKKVKWVLKGRNAMLKMLIGWERGYEVDCELFRVSCPRSVSLLQIYKIHIYTGSDFSVVPQWISTRSQENRAALTDKLSGWPIMVSLGQAGRKLVDVDLLWPLGPGQSQNENSEG